MYGREAVITRGQTKSPKPQNQSKPWKAMARKRANVSYLQSRFSCFFFLRSGNVQARRRVQDIQERSKDIITHAQFLGLIEELLCAVILSRPISHPLRLQNIRTMPIHLTSSRMWTPSDPQAKIRFVKTSMTREISIKVRRQKKLSLSPRL